MWERLGTWGIKGEEIKKAASRKEQKTRPAGTNSRAGHADHSVLMNDALEPSRRLYDDGQYGRRMSCDSTRMLLVSSDPAVRS